jgi:hypothetical protein
MDRVRHFWQRVSEGREIDDLWSQFVADARASYGFYGPAGAGLCMWQKNFFGRCF